MSDRAVIFGTGSLGQMALFYLTNDSKYDVSAFVATADAISGPTAYGLPLVAFDAIEDHYPANEYDMFIAVGYAQLNRVRERFFNEAKTKGYKLLGYISSKATIWDANTVGENVFIFEDNTIQPFATIGDNVIMWSGNHIGHHSKIGNNCFLTSHVVISGYVTVGENTFFGVNATVGDRVTIGAHNLIGPNALIMKNTKANEAYFPDRTKKFPKESSKFLR